MNVVAVPPASMGIAVRPQSRENPTPTPVPGGARVLESQGVGEFYVHTRGEVLLVEAAHPFEVAAQRLLEAVREHGDAVLLPLAVAHGQFVAFEVEVFHPQSRAFEEAQPRAVHQGSHEAQASVESTEDLADLLAAQDQRD